MSIIEFNEEDGQDFDKLLEEHKDNPIFVDFNASWCGPCRALKPMLEKICEKNNFVLIAVDVDNNPDLSEKYEIQGIPYVMVFKGWEKIFEFTGFKQEKLDEAVEKAKS